MKDLQAVFGDVQKELKSLNFLDSNSVGGKVSKERVVIVINSRNERELRIFESYILDKNCENVSLSRPGGVYGDSLVIKITSDNKPSEKREKIISALETLKSYIHNYKIRR